MPTNSTMLQLMTQVTSELGVSVPSFVIGNTTQDVVQLLALMNACGYELLRKHEWRQLTKPYRFYTESLSTTGTWTTSALTITGLGSTTGLDTTYQATGTGIPQDTFIVSVDSSSQVTLNQYPQQAETNGDVQFVKVKYALPTDYDQIVNRTQWDKSQHWEMLGPEDPQQWEWINSGYISTGPRIRWRLYGNYFQIWPGVTTGDYLGYEYRSRGWALSSTGTAQNSFTADTDTCIYPDRLMVLFTKLKYFEAKGFDTTAMYRNFEDELTVVMSQDMGAANISFAPRPGTVLVSYDNIPDSGYGTTG